MNPKAFYLKNHSSSELFAADLAALQTLSTRPTFADKKAYAAWCHDSSTEHVFYVLYEPEMPGQRSGAQNPVKFCHGLVADYDGHPAAIDAALPNLSFKAGCAPAWVTTTYSGKARLIWIFERPIPCYNPDVMGRLRATLAKQLKVRDLLPGLDEGAFDNPHTPFELGTNWRQPWGDTRVSSTVLMAALHSASAKAKFTTTGPEIPVEAVEAEVHRRWPGRWTGAFVPGAQGVRFWDANADCPTGAWIRDHGVQAFTGESKFMPWGEILGQDFVKAYVTNRIGGAIDGIYYDGREYWQLDERGRWSGFSGQQIARRMNVQFGLSTESRRGAASEVASAMTSIESCKKVDGAFPCLFSEKDVVEDGNRTYLNISRAKCIRAGDTVRQWGEGFPWLAAYIDGLFDQQQKEVFLSWLAHFYNNARTHTPRKGHALFVAGPVSAGKTFLSQRVVGGLVGGFSDASAYLLGKTDFNEELFYDAIWGVDDAVAGSDPKRHAHYSQMVKKFVANPHQTFHPKFKKAVTFRYQGRLIVTLNLDEESVSMLPSLDHSILDKLIILKAANPGTSFKGAEETVRDELPAFAEFIARWQTPVWLTTREHECNRFGHDAFAHPELLATAADNSSSVGMRELLEKWRVLHFRGVKADTWTGTVTELQSELQDTESLAKLADRVAYSRNHFGQQLKALQRQGTDWISDKRNNSGLRAYTIRRPAGV